MALRLVFCGDTMLHPTAFGATPFKQVEHITRNAHLAFCNLEACVGAIGEARKKRHILSTRVEDFVFLKEAGFHVLNLANNHTQDFGTKACREMITNLRDQGFKLVGLAAQGDAIPVIMEVNGRKIGLLGYANYGFQDDLMPLRPSKVIAAVSSLKQDVDLVIVSLHWGFELVQYPSPWQQRFARQLIECGAHLVIGHHPHVIQGIERFKNGLIAYSLGNFQFRLDGMSESLSVGNGIILSTEVTDRGKIDYQLISVQTTQEKEVVPDIDQQNIRERVAVLSCPLQGRRIARLFWLQEASKRYFPLQIEAWRYRIREFGLREVPRLVQWFCNPLNSGLGLFYLWNLITGRITENDNLTAKTRL